MDKIIKISRNLADILLLFTRDPRALPHFEEVEFYSNTTRGLIGVIAYDIYDEDFNFVILSRDDSRQFQAITIKIDFPTIDQARQALEQEMNSDQLIFHDNAQFFDIFQDIQKPEQQHPFFNY